MLFLEGLRRERVQGCALPKILLNCVAEQEGCAGIKVGLLPLPPPPQVSLAGIC